MSALTEINQLKTESSLRPVMHQVKIFAPLISAVNERLAHGLATQEIQTIIAETDGIINSVLSFNQLPIPGEEWQRATIRTAILPLIIADIKKLGEIRANQWLGLMNETTKSLNIQPSSSLPQNKPASQVKLTLADCVTRLLQATQEFSFFRPQSTLVNDLIRSVFKDSKELYEKMNCQLDHDAPNVMSNFLTNHTHLMVSALTSEKNRIEPSLSERDIINHPNGLPLDGLFDKYSQNKATLSNLVSLASEQKTDSGNTQTPSFLNP